MSECMSDTVSKFRDPHLAGNNITETGSPGLAQCAPALPWRWCRNISSLGVGAPAPPVTQPGFQGPPRP